MGTRSLTVVNNEEGKELLTLYRQNDGYPSGHGQELADFLKPFRVVNGLSGEIANKANGMGCLAAQIVAHFKGGADLRAQILETLERISKGPSVGLVQVFKELKDKAETNMTAGGFYLYPPGTRDCGEEYIYTVYPGPVNGGINLKVQAGSMTFFGLPGSKQDSMNVLYDGPVAKFNAKAAEKVEENLPAPKNDFVEEQEKKQGKKAGAAE